MDWFQLAAHFPGHSSSTYEERFIWSDKDNVNNVVILWFVCLTTFLNNIQGRAVSPWQLIFFSSFHYMGVGDEGRGHVPPKIREIFFGQLQCKIRAFFSSKNHVKFGNFVNFSGKYHKNSGILILIIFIHFFRAKLNVQMSCPPKGDWAPTSMHSNELIQWRGVRRPSGA